MLIELGDLLKAWSIGVPYFRLRCPHIFLAYNCMICFGEKYMKLCFYVYIHVWFMMLGWWNIYSLCNNGQYRTLSHSVTCPVCLQRKLLWYLFLPFSFCKRVSLTFMHLFLQFAECRYPYYTINTCQCHAKAMCLRTLFALNILYWPIHNIMKMSI